MADPDPLHKAPRSWTLVAPDGSEAARGGVNGEPRTRRPRDEARVADWYRGDGTYVIKTVGDEYEAIERRFEVRADTASISASLGLLPSRRGTVILIARRAPTSLAVNVEATPERLVVTLTNGSAETIAPAAGVWRESIDLRLDGPGPTPVVASPARYRMMGVSRTTKPDAPLAPGESTTITLGFTKTPLPAGTRHMRVTYELPDHDLRFVTDTATLEVLTDSDAPTQPPSSTGLMPLLRIDG